ncbi:MAG: DEAD/DEAH box helicase [Firmicutes bacterium]|nr:DEAD/DEAH box helicase [Bacillota bacterium]
MNFNELGIDENLTKGLNAQGIYYPTEIQEKSIPHIIQRKNVVIKSETGSGKTLAYILPLFASISPSLRSTQAIIITPTHELAVQVSKQARILAENSGSSIKTALIIGGADISRQLDKLKEKPQIVVGSAGRILDLIKKKKIQAHTCKTIVIDEADRMLDSLNIDTVKAIIKTTLASERQLVFLSASIDKKTQNTISEMTDDYTLIQNEKIMLPESIVHHYIICDKRDKIVMLRKIVAGMKPKRLIVFLNNPNSIEEMVEKLNYHGLKAGGIYGAAHKADRRNTMESFREGRSNILIASDIGARGLDFDDVEIVVNIDIPEEPVYYQHRAGRTGRNGASGTVINIVAANEKKWISRYEKTYNIVISEKVMSYGKLSDPVKKTSIKKKK